eukprot:jgi/Ulvmu1/3081/UM015_0121.1
MGPRVVKALAFPVYQKDWLFYAWKVSELPVDATSQPNESSTQSPGLFGAIVNRVTARVQAEWKSVKEAKEGTVKGYVLRFANFVLSKEDPTEAFFKAIPSTGKGNALEISYPNSFSEAYVRRHLLFTARNRVKYHQNWQRVTTFALIPLSPLALSPFPNLPIYYIAYRVYSHRLAHAGADTVLEYLEHLETYKPSAPDPDSQPYNKGQSSLHNSFDYSVTTHVRFRPCADLSEVAASRDREASALPDEVAQAIADHYDDKNIVSAIVKIRKRAEQGEGSPDAADGKEPSTWLQRLQRLW